MIFLKLLVIFIDFSILLAVKTVNKMLRTMIYVQFPGLFSVNLSRRLRELHKERCVHKRVNSYARRVIGSIDSQNGLIRILNQL